MAYLATRVSTIPTEGKFPVSQVMHPEVKESQIDPFPFGRHYFGIHAEIHVPVQRRVVMFDL
jgi:hypothetical protein